MSASAQQPDSCLGRIRSVLTGVLRLAPEWHSVEKGYPLLVMSVSNDVAAFAVASDNVRKSYDEAYTTFKRLYAEKGGQWSDRNLSFVLCRTDSVKQEDAFCREIETDVYFCRKYVLDCQDPKSDLRPQVARLPFFPIDQHSIVGIERRPPAKAVLQAIGVPLQLTDLLVNPGRKTAEGIAELCLQGDFVRSGLTVDVSVPPIEASEITDTKSLAALEMEDFRAYKGRHAFDLDGDVVLLYGSNGLGKTSFFDAIDFLCTGRIARFDTKELDDFARVTTNLSGSEGSCNVLGSFKHDGVVTEFRRSLQSRNDVQSSTQTYDRKDFLSWLTDISSSEARAHVQYLQQLWRATHYFGQGHQALFDTFDKSGELSEDVVARMLAAQDYVTASKKISEISSVLKRRLRFSTEKRQEMKGTIEGLRHQLNATEKIETRLETTAGVRNLLRELRTQIQDVCPAIVDVGDDDESTLRSWRSILTAEIEQARDTLKALETLRPIVTLQLEAEAQLEALKQTAVATLRQCQSLEHKLRQQEDQLRVWRTELDEKRRALLDAQERQTALKWLLGVKPSWSRYLRRESELRDTVEKTERGLTRLDEEIAVQRQTIAKAQSTLTQARTLYSRQQSGERSIKQLNDDLGAWRVTLARSTEVDRKLAQLTTELESLVIEQNACEARRVRALAELEQARQRLRSEEQERERLTSLISEIAAFVQSGECPLCGHVYESAQVLKSKMAALKTANPTPSSEIFAAVESARLEEASVREDLGRLAAMVTNARKTKDQLDALKEAAEKELNQFEKRAKALELPADLQALEVQLGQKVFDTRKATVSAESRAAVREKEMHEAEETLGSSLRARGGLSEGLEKARQELEDVSNGQRQLMLEATTKGIDLDLSTDVVDVRIESYSSAIVKASTELFQLQDNVAGAEKVRTQIANELKGAKQGLQTTRSRIDLIEKRGADIQRRSAELHLGPKAVTLGELDELNTQLTSALGRLERTQSETKKVEVAISESKLSAQVSDLRRQLDDHQGKLSECERERQELRNWLEYFHEMQRHIDHVRTTAVDDYVRVLGPMASVIQTRLRGVYGFGEISLEPAGKSVVVRADHQGRRLRPTDYFSDSQRQILMLSLFLSASITQTWSQFAPVLLDDPVTHLDGLNEYAFADLLRLIVEEKLLRRQLIVSTCDEQLFELFLQKLGRSSFVRVVAYEFVSIGDAGPVVRRRPSGRLN